MSEDVVPYEAKAIRSTVVRPLVSPAEGKVDWDDYIGLCNAILAPEDYQAISGKRFKKKSAWRKLARAFSVADRILAQHIERNERGWPIFATFTVEAESPNGQTAIGYHECHVSERCCPMAWGKPCPKAGWQKHECCASGCDGWIHWSHPGDIPATAHTRAKNRAIADLIGAGEVSAEEMEGTAEEMDGAKPRQAQPARTRVSLPDDKKSQRRFWGEATKLGFPNAGSVHAALGLPAQPGALGEYIKNRTSESGEDDADVWGDLLAKLTNGEKVGSRVTQEEIRQEQGAERAAELPFE